MRQIVTLYIIFLNKSKTARFSKCFLFKKTRKITPYESCKHSLKMYYGAYSSEWRVESVVWSVGSEESGAESAVDMGRLPP